MGSALVTGRVLFAMDGARISLLVRGQPPGSLTLHPAPGAAAGTPPRMILFGWLHDTPGVWESMLGLHDDGEIFRTVHSADLRQRSFLTEPYELDYWSKPPRRWLHKLRFELVT